MIKKETVNLELSYEQVEELFFLVDDTISEIESTIDELNFADSPLVARILNLKSDDYEGLKKTLVKALGFNIE